MGFIFIKHNNNDYHIVLIACCYHTSLVKNNIKYGLRVKHFTLSKIKIALIGIDTAHTQISLNNFIKT